MKAWPALVLLPILAGCAAPAPSSPARDAPQEAPAETGFSAGLFLSHATWTSATTGALALELIFRSVGPTRCDFEAELWGEGATFGPRAMLGTDVPEQGDAAWSIEQYHATAQTHASIVDTRSLDDAGGAWDADLRTVADTENATYRFTLLAQGLVPAADPDGVARSVALHLMCTRPVLLLEIARGDEARLFDAQSLAGGSGASVDRSGSTSVDDALALSVKSDEGRLRVYAAPGAGAGTIDLAAPAGSRSWALGGGVRNGAEYQGGSGDYAIRLSWVGVNEPKSLWGALYGLSPVVSLDD